MRQILFKVWDKREKEMSLSMPLVMLAGWIAAKRSTGRDLEDFEYLEGTGFQDKKGRHIFEDDFVQAFVTRANRKGIVKIIWHEELGQFLAVDPENEESVTHGFHREYFRDMEVIGDARQTPEILK